MPLRECPSTFTIIRWRPIPWTPFQRSARMDISCGRATVDSTHQGKHGGVVAGEIDGVPTRMDVEW